MDAKKNAKWMSAIKQAFFPDTYNCIFCGREMPPQRTGTCDFCKKGLPFVVGPCCIKCGKPIFREEEDAQYELKTEGVVQTDANAAGVYCSNCRNKDRAFDEAASTFSYGGVIQHLVHHLKFRDGAYLAPYISAYLVDTYVLNPIDVDVVTAVPMTRKAQRRRGYNQAELVANDFAARVNIPYGAIVHKVKETVPQEKLGAKERSANLEGAFRADECKGQRVLIIDDVLTTGQTIHEVARALKKAGARRVYALTFANVPDTLPKKGRTAEEILKAMPEVE